MEFNKNPRIVKKNTPTSLIKAHHLNVNKPVNVCFYLKKEDMVFNKYPVQVPLNAFHLGDARCTNWTGAKQILMMDTCIAKGQAAC